MLKFSCLFIIIISLCLGCKQDNSNNASIKGVVDSITPLGGDHARARILVKFKDGRCCNVNYWGGQVHSIVIGKYNVISYDNFGDITDVSQVEAEIGEN